MPSEKPVRRKDGPKYIIKHIVDHSADKRRVLIKWARYRKLEWNEASHVNEQEVDEYFKSIKEKIGFMSFLQKKHRKFESDWLECLRFKMRSRCMYGLKALQVAQAKWAMKADNLRSPKRQKRAKWRIAPFYSFLDETRRDHLNAHSRFDNTFKHLLTCVQALIISGEVSVATAFKGHVAELSWQSRFYEVLKYMSNQNAEINTASFYENQQSLGMDSRVSDFFLVNKGTKFDFYEVVGELKNSTKSNPEIFSKLLDYLHKRWKLVPPIINADTQKVIMRKEPVALIVINERITITERFDKVPSRGGAKTRRYEIFCPVPYVVWNSNKTGASRLSRDMIESFNFFFDVPIPWPAKSKNSNSDDLDRRINDVLNDSYRPFIDLSVQTRTTEIGNLLYQAKYRLKAFPERRDHENERASKRVRRDSIFMDGSVDAFHDLLHTAAYRQFRFRPHERRKCTLH